MKYTIHAIQTGELESMPEVSLMGGGRHPGHPLGGNQALLLPH